MSTEIVAQNSDTAQLVCVCGIADTNGQPCAYCQTPAGQLRYAESELQAADTEVESTGNNYVSAPAGYADTMWDQFQAALNRRDVAAAALKMARLAASAEGQGR